jgi:hypothetical protein
VSLQGCDVIVFLTCLYIVTEQQAETYGALPGSEAEADRERSDSAGELTTKDNLKLVAQRIFSGGNSAELDRGESTDRSVLSLISSYFIIYIPVYSQLDCRV